MIAPAVRARRSGPPIPRQLRIRRRGGRDDNDALFSLRDRRTIRTCVNEHASTFPAGATQRPELPSGSERQIHRGGTLPSEVQNQAQSLPLACEEQLPKLPNDLERVIYAAGHC